MLGKAYQNHVKETYACFHCRKSFKQAQEYHLCNSAPTDADGKRLAPCPECQAPMRNMGKFFKAPRQADIHQWRKVETLFQHGFDFHYYSSGCGCSRCSERPREMPATLREVPAFLEEQKQAQKERKRQSEIQTKAQEREKLRNKKRKMRAVKLAAKTNPA